MVGLLLCGTVVAAGSLGPAPRYPSKQEDNDRPTTLREPLNLTVGHGDDSPRLVAARDSSSARRGAPVAPARSPRAAVRRLRRWVAIGAPTLPFLYDPAVVRYLGSRLILQSLAPLLNVSLRAKLRQDRVDGGVIVMANVRNPGSPPTIDKYLVIRRQGSWLVRYDSVLTAQIGQLAQKSAQGGRDAASQRAVAAGEKAKDSIVSRLAPSSLIDRLTAP